MKVIARGISALLLALALWLAISAISAPVYSFPEPEEFSGELIYNPYASFDSAVEWKKANFHAHSRLPLNLTNGALTPDEAVREYRSYGYDIIGISNYQTITRYEPEEREEYNIPLYEHGFNIMLFHQLVFGENGHTNFDIPLPLTLSHRQKLLSYLDQRADLVCLNHPNFTRRFKTEDMRYLRGYRLIEAVSGMASSEKYWDTALSSGIPSFILAGDDSHNQLRPHDIATDCTFIGCETTKYGDIVEALRKGNHFAMRIPNFGEGDTAVKHEANRNLPAIEDIGLRGDVIYIKLSQRAQIEFIGRDGRVLFTTGSDAAEFTMDENPYVRVRAEFGNGIKIYTNPFFRYRSGEEPFGIEPPAVNIQCTIIQSVLLIAVSGAILWAILRLLGFNVLSLPCNSMKRWQRSEEGYR